MKMDMKSFDWKRYSKYFDAKSSQDLNAFLENMPEKAGHTVLIAAGIIWAVAAGLGLYTATQTQKLTELRQELKEVNALKPKVPTIQRQALSKEELEKFVADAAEIYKNLNIRLNRGSIVITARSTRNFGEFREAIGHVQNGGNGWQVTLENMCVGRECNRGTHLTASLKIEKVTVKNPG